MSDPSQHSGFLEIASKVAPGFLGSVVAAVYVQRPVNKFEGLVAILSGAFTSVFITPYIVSLIAPGNEHALAGIGYGVGMGTVIVLPPLMRRVVEIVSQLSLADFLGLGKKKE